MEAVVQSSQQHALTEDSSDRSESSTMSQEYQIRGFESYEIVKRLNLAVGERGIARDEPSPSKTKDFRVCVESASSIKQQHPHNHHHHHHHHHHQESGLHLDEVNENLRELAVSMGKSKELSFDGGQIGEALGYQMDSRASDAEVTTMETSENPICRTKEQLAATKEAFQARQKYINASFDRSPKRFNSLVEREIKEYGLAKGYNLPLERMKEFNLPLDRMRDCHMTVLPRERLAGIGLLENSRILEGSDHRNFHVQSRSPHLETMAYERMRRSQHHLLNQMDFTAQNLVGSQLPHGRQSIASQIQQSHQQQQQQQQQPQIKSFTIDAILAHRNNQKERHRSQQQQLRKAARQECQEVALKSGNGGGSSITGSNANGGSNGSGKAKRVRTIFTAEQLERLEGEFARQQYMVGPERLYLAHALRLTEAQVKVWFQNRRIKWRKVNHEQQCLAVSEHRQRCTLPSLEIHEVHEDESNENNAGKWCANEDQLKRETWHKYRLGRETDLRHDRSERRHSNPPVDTTTGYHCAGESYRPRKHHGLSAGSRTRYLVPSVPEEAYRAESKNYGILRALKKEFYPSNVAVVRKTRYKDEVDEEEVEDSKYVVQEVAGEDNVEEDTGEEVVDEERENGSECSDGKEYEEQEADDEVDEESDALERQMDGLRIQRKGRVESSLRGQRTVAEPSYHHHHHNRGRKMDMERGPERCRHTVAERDNVQVPTEEEDDDQDLRDETAYPTKKSTWRYQPTHQDRDHRIQPRNFVGEYSDLNGTSSGLTRQTRRPRTTKPDVESSMTSNRLTNTNIRNHRCSRCELANRLSAKTTSSRNASCRLRDSRYLTRAPIGDEGEGFDDAEPGISYRTKPRRSKESRSPMYDPREEAKTMDAELGAIYKSGRSKNLRNLSSGERARHSVRVNAQQDPPALSRNENRYW